MVATFIYLNITLPQATLSTVTKPQDKQERIRPIITPTHLTHNTNLITPMATLWVLLDMVQHLQLYSANDA
jgi:hypothetical protein